MNKSQKKAMTFEELRTWLQEHGIFFPVRDDVTGVTGEAWISCENLEIPNRVFESMSLNNVVYMGSMVSTSEARSHLN